MLLSALHVVHDAVTEHSVRVGHLVVARTAPDFLSYNIDAFELVAPRPVLQTKLRPGLRGARPDLNAISECLVALLRHHDCVQ